MNLLGLTALLDVAKPADWEHTQVANLVESIMGIPTIFKHAASESEVDATISRIVKQDLNSKVLPVSSWQWANLLSSLSSAHGTSFKDAIDLYNDHPAVVGTRDSADSAGTGSLEIDTKKQRAIKHWMDKTSEGAFHEVDMHCHDIPFALGAFGEQFAQEAAYFLNSVVELAADPACTLTPMEGESSITINWKLPMPDDVDINCPQKWFFRRIKFQFHRETSIVPVQQKKKYRISKESGLKLRNIMCLVSQAWPLITQAFTSDDVSELVTSLSETGIDDSDWAEIIELRPSNFSISMLKSRRTAEQARLEHDNRAAYAEVEKEKNEVRMARWKLFVAGLRRDQLNLTATSKAPRAMAAALHKKGMEWKRQESEKGNKAVTGYMNDYLRIASVAKPPLALDVINKYVQDIMKLKNITTDDLHFIGLGDGNSPNARTQTGAKSMCQVLHIVNSMKPTHSACLLTVPDLPLDSSARGLDEGRPSCGSSCGTTISIVTPAGSQRLTLTHGRKHSQTKGVFLLGEW